KRERVGGEAGNSGGMPPACEAVQACQPERALQGRVLARAACSILFSNQRSMHTLIGIACLDRLPHPQPFSRLREKGAEPHAICPNISGQSCYAKKFLATRSDKSTAQYSAAPYLPPGVTRHTTL